MVFLAQLREAGLTRRQVEFRVTAGRLHAVERGLYAVGHSVLSREGRWTAAVLSCGPDAVLSHRAAAAHWQILPPSSGRIDVTLPRRTGRCGRARITIHRVRSLIDDERTARLHRRDHRGPNPRRSRRARSTRTVERAVEESERRRVFDLGAIRMLLER